MTGWPSAGAGTASRAGWPPAHPGRAPLPPSAVPAGGHLAAARPQRHPTTTAAPQGDGAGARAGRGAVGRRRGRTQPLDGAGGGDRRRHGELCGLEWADLDPDAGTVRFHQALTIIAPAVLPEADPSAGGQHKELAVGPVKSPPATPPDPASVRGPGAAASPAASRPACVSPAGSPKPSRWEGSNPAGHPSRSSSTWCSAPSRAPRSTPPRQPSLRPGRPPASGWLPIPTCCGDADGVGGASDGANPERRTRPDRTASGRVSAAQR